jgi:hypothetical protein
MGEKNQRKSASFADVNDVTGSIVLRQGERMSISISGTWAGTIDLQRKVAGTFRNVDSQQWTANAEADYQAGGRGEFRLIFTADTSGTADVEIWT